MNNESLRPLGIDIKEGQKLTLAMVREFYHDAVCSVVESLVSQLQRMMATNYRLRQRIALLEGVDISWIDDEGKVIVKPDPHLQAMEASPHVEIDRSGVQSPAQEDWPDGDEQFRYITNSLSPQGE